MVADNNTHKNDRQRWVAKHLPTAVSKVPRPYQDLVFQAFTNRFETHKKSLAHLATGAGKTYITMEWLRRQIADGKVTTKKPPIWMVHRSTIAPSHEGIVCYSA